MPIADLRDVQLHYEVSGSVAGPVIVLSHSLGTDLRLWEPQLKALGRTYRLLRYDTRGHGKSSFPDGDYTLEQLGNDVLQLLDHLDIPQAAFCGISLGGLIALWLGVHAPERITAIVAANTAARIGSVAGWTDRIEQVRSDGLRPVIEGTLERWLTADHRVALAPTVAYLREVLASTSVEGYTACCAALRDADLRTAISSIRVPTLAIAGSHDPVTPPSDANFLQQQIPTCRYAELDAAHLSNLGAADMFNTAVLDFIVST